VENMLFLHPRTLSFVFIVAADLEIPLAIAYGKIRKIRKKTKIYGTGNLLCASYFVDDETILIRKIKNP
jgi:hypothetical protein